VDTLATANGIVAPADSEGMNVLLFDLYAGGHHLEFASELRAELLTRDPSLTVDFLTVAPTENHGMYFDDGEVDFLRERSPLTHRPGVVPDRDPFATGYDFLATSVRNPVWGLLGEFADYAAAGDYDVVHVLEADKVLPELRYRLDRADLPPTVATINGVYFKPDRAPLPAARPLRTALGGSSGLGRAFARYCPPVLRRGRAWDRWYLGTCLDAGVFDHLTVPSAAAQAEVAGDADGTATDRISVVPDPVESWDPADLGQSEARERLDIPDDGPVLLFFGQMREEKGIGTLLEAVERYDGEPFTLVLAGPPSAVSSAEVAAAAEGAPVSVVDRLEYVPEEDVFAYFRAADGAVLPYEHSFGELRPSTVFTKACAAGRPVIASDFGTLGQLVRQWDLGLLSEPGSSESLAATLAEFVASEEPVHDADAMATYVAAQTYERLTETVYAAYRRVAAERGNE